MIWQYDLIPSWALNYATGVKHFMMIKSISGDGKKVGRNSVKYVYRCRRWNGIIKLKSQMFWCQCCYFYSFVPFVWFFLFVCFLISMDVYVDGFCVNIFLICFFFLFFSNNFSMWFLVCRKTQSFLFNSFYILVGWLVLFFIFFPFVSYIFFCQNLILQLTNKIIIIDLFRWYDRMPLSKYTYEIIIYKHQQQQHPIEIYELTNERI